MDSAPDSELVDAARAGSAEAFGELVHRHQRRAFALAYSLLGDGAEAEDMVQEAFLRAYRNLDLLADPAKFGAWLRRIVFGTCVDWLRAFRPAFYRSEAEPGEENRVPSLGPSPLERVERMEISERVLAAVGRLPERYRVPLTLYHLEGVSQKKVALALDIEESSVRSLLTRARQRLAVLLAADAKEFLEMDEHPEEVFDEQRDPPRLLHVLNGDCTRLQLEGSDVPGTLAVWADVLHEGPVPAEEASAERWREVRVRYHLAVGNAPSEEVLSYEAAMEYYRRWDEALERHAEYDEVVIWCEHDLFDQLLLIRHLDWFGRRDLGGTRLSLICIGEYPGMPGFKGLGELTPDQLGSLLGTRQRVTPRQMELGRAAWRAFTSPDPLAVERFLQADTSPLRFLARALRRHLEEFPGVHHGLSRTEHQILRLLDARPTDLVELFRALHAIEDAYYITDRSLRSALRQLAAEPDPALRIDLEEGGQGSLPRGTVRITELGRALLAGREDWIRIHGIDRWLGGVHLTGSAVPWRWDADAGRLQAAR